MKTADAHRIVATVVLAMIGASTAALLAAITVIARRQEQRR
ncbi:MAG TPA: hypothetical protein VHK06_01410 [Candidatus Limnocylindria bacterium]|nr:hypothetical protein [Candidatus Limnocylindria bacterium]